MQLAESGTEYTVEELGLQTKSLSRLSMDFGINTCKLCQVKDRSDWQVTEFDDSWNFLCGQCRQKLSEKLNKNDSGIT
jgi:predicted SprT family Zn-dependent metalloprotease